MRIILAFLCFMAVSVSAWALTPAMIGAVSHAGCNCLSDVITSAVVDLDATKSASYTGSGQTWANLIAAPADGAAQTDYDMYLGADNTATTDDPTFIGGAGSNAAYFAMDGGDHFSLKSGVNTNFLKNLHKTTGGQDWWAAITIKTVDFTANNTVFSTQSSSTGIGLRAHFTASETLANVQRGDTTAVGGGSTITTSISSDAIGIVSHSHSQNKTRVWLSRSGSTSVGEEFAHTYNGTTTDATSALKLSILSTSNRFQNGVRVYSFAMGNEYLDNTKAAAIIAHLETRHGRDYTP